MSTQKKAIGIALVIGLLFGGAVGFGARRVSPAADEMRTSNVELRTVGLDLPAATTPRQTLTTSPQLDERSLLRLQNLVQHVQITRLEAERAEMVLAAFLSSMHVDGYVLDPETGRYQPDTRPKDRGSR
jgi:hypothetical protein